MRQLIRGNIIGFDSLRINTNVQYSSDMISQFIHSKRDLVKKWIQVELAQCLQCFIPFTQLPFLKVLNRFNFYEFTKAGCICLQSKFSTWYLYIFTICYCFTVFLLSEPAVNEYVVGRGCLWIQERRWWYCKGVVWHFWKYLLSWSEVSMKDTTLISECLA